MRLLVPSILLLGAATGCSSERLTFDHDSELWSQTRGLALHDDGDIGHAAMNGTTCEFFTQGAALGGDYDLPSDLETVVDARGDFVLATSVRGVHVVDTAAWPIYDTIEVSDAIDAQLYSGGVAILRVGAVEFHGDTGSTIVELPTGQLSGFAVDRFTGAAYVVQPNGVFQATPEGVLTQLDGQGGLARFDSDHGFLYMASPGSSELAGLDVQTGELWTQQLGGAVVSMDTVGSSGQAAVMTDVQTGGEIVIVDVTGEAVQHVSTPGIGDVEFAADGGTMALVTPDLVHFYDVSLGGGVPVYYSKEAAGVTPPPQFSD